MTLFYCATLISVVQLKVCGNMGWVARLYRAHLMERTAFKPESTLVMACLLFAIFSNQG